ncbi:MAG: iron ABC transporter permease, partial [Treponema sp.]|nr:iron ABC transporter permease [Treponema sp.]
MGKMLSRSRRELKALAGDPLLLLIITLIFISLILFIVYPLIKVILVSFQTTPGGAFSLAVFQDVFKSRYLGQAFWNSV